MWGKCGEPASRVSAECRSTLPEQPKSDVLPVYLAGKEGPSSHPIAAGTQLPGGCYLCPFVSDTT